MGILTQKLRLSSWSQRTTLLAGLVSVLLSIIVLVGWHTHRTALIQVLPTFVPMQYNTALAFLLSGLALLSITQQHTRITVLGGIAVTTIGLLTLSEYVFRLDLGIDQLLMAHYITIETSHPSRMAPNTAVCFFLTGIALAIMPFFTKLRRGSLLLGGLAATVLVLGSISLVGYLSGSPTAYGWGHLTRMAAHTSAGFIVLGAGIMAQAWHEGLNTAFEPKEGAADQRRRVFLFAVGIMALATFTVTLHVVRELQHVAIEQRKEDLSAHTRSWATLMEAVARFDAMHSESDHPEGAPAATLAQFAAAQEELGDVWGSGRLALAERTGDQISYLHGEERLQTIEGFGSTNDAMNRALDGDSGVMIIAEGTSEAILAAYEPIAFYGWALVAHIKLEELQAPYQGMIILALGTAFIVIILGALALLLTVDPIIQGIARRTADLKQEVSEHQRTEDALRKSRETSRALLNAPTESLILVHRNSTILDLNEIAAQRIGKSLQEIKGKNLFDLFPKELADGRQHYFDKVLETRRSVNFEDQREGITFSNAIHPIFNEQYEVDRVAVFAQDVTAHKKLEAQLRHAQKMEGIGQLAGGIAHDFNNLLHAILGYGDIAHKHIKPNTDTHDAIEEILKAAERARVLVSQLLAFSRQQVLDMKDLDLNNLIKNVISMIQRVMEAHITLNTDLAHNLGAIHADQGQIEQILMNLCINARDAMPAGGTITIKTQPIHIDDKYCATHSWAKPGKFICLAVSDTGSGIDEEFLDQVFEPFFTTKQTGEGTGLGLATVYGLVMQHQGMINPASEVGKGTTFNVYLPMIDRLPINIPNKEEKRAQGGTETILVAEDEETVRDLTRTNLQRAGYTVLTASDGVEAIQILKDNPNQIQLALLDVMMPKLGGPAVSEWICENHPQIRVLFASGYSMDAIHSDFVLDDGLALIQKPFARHTLLQKIREILDQ